MTKNIQTSPDIERVIWITVDCLRWDYHERYRDLYPEGIWYRGVPQATYTPTSHASAFTGLNPPRHGVYTFGDLTPKDSIFDITDSISFSKITQNWDMLTLDSTEVRPSHIPFAHLLDENDTDGDTWQFHLAPMDDTDYELIGDHDLSFLHDWIVHGTGPSHSDWDWTRKVTDDDDPATNHEKYQHHVELSVAAHRDFLAELKARDLYEDSLFIVWGDHGQALNEKPFEQTGHNHFPEDEVARVPIGFCSPQFEQGRDVMDDMAADVDTQTNARGVDILPTLESVFDAADLRWDGLDHEVEGVDLTTFNGSLVGYSMGGKTYQTSTNDGVKTNSHSLLMDGKQFLVESDNYDTREKVEYDGPARQLLAQDDLLEQKLEQFYKKARTEHAQLIAREQPDEAFLRDMGYME